MTGLMFLLFYMLILLIFKVAILKIIYNMASTNINLTLKVTGSLTLTSTLLLTYNNEKRIYLLVKLFPLVNGNL